MKKTVGVIGSGFSGISAATEEVNWVVFEGNDSIRAFNK